MYRRFNRIFKRTVRCHFVFKIIWQIIPYFCPSIFYREFSITSMYHRSWSCVIVVYIFIFWKIISEVWEQIAFITGAFLWAKRGEHCILREAWDEGRRKIKRLLPLHCSGSSHVMTKWTLHSNWLIDDALIWPVCLACLSGKLWPSKSYFCRTES